MVQQFEELLEFKQFDPTLSLITTPTCIEGLTIVKNCSIWTSKWSRMLYMKLSILEVRIIWF